VPLYYINNGRFENMKRENENFDKNFLYHAKGTVKEITSFLSKSL
jgi:hypothetical protein